MGRCHGYGDKLVKVGKHGVMSWLRGQTGEGGETWGDVMVTGTNW